MCAYASGFGRHLLIITDLFRYVKGNWVNLAFALLGMGIALGLTTYFRKENRRRYREQGDGAEKPQQMDFEDRYDKSRYFRYVV